MRYIDLENKKLRWYNRNLFYTGTAFVIIINVLAYLIGGSRWELGYVTSKWTDVLRFDNLVACFLSAFKHSNLQHCLLNSLCFLVAGTYVERKIGTVNILVLVASFAFFCGCAVAANHSGTSVGFSGVNYAFYAYIIIDYVFMFIDKKQTKANTIYGAIVLALIYLSTCFCGGTSSFSFKIYPYDLITNMGHYTSFLTGGILMLLLQFVKKQADKKTD